MAQKPYKYQIEYIQKFYSYGSEAKVIEFKPVYKEEPKPVPPKHEKEPVTKLCIDPLAFCGLMVAVVIPQARKSRIVAALVAVSFLLSWVFSQIPGVRDIAEGTRTILLTVLISAAAALLLPRKEDA